MSGGLILDGKEIVLFSKRSRLPLGPIHPPLIQWIPGVLSLGIKQLVHKAEHSSLSGVEVMND
jgi:hypothetical protein